MLTFKAMHEDCESHGCWLERHVWPPFDAASPEFMVVYSHSGFCGPGYQDTITDLEDPAHLARIDAWRKDLHP